jgi:orotidine-5'-phosphate decarboxylase
LAASSLKPGRPFTLSNPDPLPDPLIIALDFESEAKATSLVAALGADISFYKVGMELYASAGMQFVRDLIASGKNVFLDMKFYDIPETVKRAVKQVSRTGVRFLTVHGSNAVMRAAVEGREDTALRLLAVTVLTSYDEADLLEMGYPVPVSDLVAQRVRNAMACGIDGIVASPREASKIRTLAGDQALIVTPGVRSRGSAAGDQKRVATPAEALHDGADYLVIGRQVIRAKDPRQALREIRAELETAQAIG